MKILVVDDDPRLRGLLMTALERAGFAVISAADGQQAVDRAAREAPDLIVLDIGLPEMDGFEACRRIRARSDVPILFLTAQDDEVDRILGLELGGDDYVTKPFSARELIARIRAILKRSTGGGRGPLRHGAIEMQADAHLCRIGDLDVPLTATEFSILSRLLADPQAVHARARLIGAVWGANSQVSDRTLDSHLRNLRAKLETAGAGDAIQTVHGVGVRLAPA